MHAIKALRSSKALFVSVFSFALAGCFGTGDGPEPIAGTPAPPPPPSLCDPSAVAADGNPFPIFFENLATSYDFGMDAGFGGGATTIQENTQCSAANPSPQVAQMEKFAAEPFGGSSLALPATVDFSAGQAFTMQVWASRSVPVTFKFEDAITNDPANGIERVETHSGNGEWQTLCFDFSGATGGFTTSAITFIFDNGVVGDAGGDPDNWTFFMDAIEQVATCPGAPTTTLPVTFEGDPTSFNFGPDGGFGGGASDVIANPDQSGENTTAQTARMQKFAGEVFGGSTLELAGNVDFTQGEAFTMKVWSTRAVPVLFKFEDAVTGDPANGIERTGDHNGGSTWETLCFDFSGATAGFSSSSITFIFDNGTNGNADNDPNAWTFYFDEIEQVADCNGGGGGGPAAQFSTLTFDDAALTYTLRGFGGAEDSAIEADPDDANNSVVRINRSDTAETFAGTVISTLANEAVGVIPLDATTTSMTLRVRAPAAGLPIRLKIENSGDPAISVEAEVLTTAANTWETLTFDFTNQVMGTAAFDPSAVYDKIAVFPNFGAAGSAAGAQTFFIDDIAVAGATPPPAAAFETLTFDDAALTYTLRGFGGAEDSSVVADPDDAGNNAVRINRADNAQTFAGTVISTLDNEAVGVIPLDATDTSMTMRVRAPAAGLPIRLKIENSGDPAISVETEAMTTGVDTWETLTFDFTNQVMGTAAFDENAVYDKVAVFPNFGADGAAAGAQTFYFDDIAVAAGGGGGGGGNSSAATDFESGMATFSDFEGGVATVIANPDASGINTSAQVGQMQKFAGQTFGGSTLQLPAPVDLAMGDSYLMKVRASREVPVLFKLETQGDERTATHSGSGTWEELCFDFSDVAVGNITGITLIFDNGTAGDAANNPDDWTFQFDDIVQTSDPCPAAPPAPVFETITFDDAGITYGLTDFGGNGSTITNDPAGGTNMVVQSVRSAAAETFAGTTVSTLPNDEIVQPIDADNLVLSVRVYSAEAGATVRLKVEDAADAGIFIETDATTTVVNDWETLNFDFGSPVGGAFNAANTYNRISIFFNFGVTGGAAGEQNWFFDDIARAAPPPAPAAFETLTFDDAGLTYTLRGFGGAEDSAVVADPDDAGNNVMRINRSDAAETFAGTVVSTLANEGVGVIPLDASNTSMTMRVRGPAAGLPIRLKIENSGDPAISVETEVLTTVAGAWETMTFDFTNQVMGTAAFDENAVYDKVAIFPNFGAAGGAAGAQTFWFDDVAVASGAGGGGAMGELTTNGSFETGDLTGWTIFDNGGSISVDTMEATDGSNSVHVIAATGQNPVIKQEFLAEGTVTAGQQVTISFDMKGSAADGGVIFPELISEEAMGASGNILETITAPTTDWTSYSYTPNAGADVTRGITLQFAIVCGGAPTCSADVFIDNVSVTLN
ncbi:MAG: carbohydrate binding domain-containing protein [Pseudomonadota bacterium]